MIFDMHCHTSEGSPDSIVSLGDTIEKLIENGYNGMLVTDHNSYKGHNSLNKQYKNFVVLRGVEYDSLDGGHLLIVLPTRIKYEIFEHRGMYAEDVIKIVHALGGIVGPAHPFDFAKLGICNTKLRHNIELLSKFDFIETFNGCLDNRGSVLSNNLAKILDKPCFGGSDSHSITKVGLGKTILPEEIKNEDDLISIVKKSGYNSFEAGGNFFHRKYKKIHSLTVITGGYVYTAINRCLSINHNKRTNAIFEALGIK